jgi:hypothetical protein
MPAASSQNAPPGALRLHFPARNLAGAQRLAFVKLLKQEVRTGEWQLVCHLGESACGQQLYN